ncbi:MAG: c-type cytochrome domain-containing protein [Planctomycetaceae bacterium]
MISATRTWICGVLLALAGGGTAFAQGDLPTLGSALVKKYCYDCHGATFNGDAFLDVMNRDALLETDHSYVVQGNLDNSVMWQRIADNEMPPEDHPQPTPDERLIIKDWILAGAPMPEREVREFVQWPVILQTIHDDLQRTQPEYRQYIRYFTMTHLYNNAHNVTEMEMRLYRAALAKSLNSVCWEPVLVLPQPLDEHQTLFRVDLRDLGWTTQQWQTILTHYPYGCGFANVPDPAVANLYRDIEQYSETPLCFIRADWFIARCMRPPVYHELLGLPKTAFELEQMLGAAVIGDFQRDRVARAGFVESGVSAGNRVVDRHRSRFGYYWKSYDFKKNTERGNIMRFPLGPDYDGHPYHQLTFEEDGGEMIFSLPNGLQGYYLVDGQGNRIDEGPIEVVRDLKETSGAPVIVNGLSCMACHRHGMINFSDTLRNGAGALGDARRKLMAIVPPPEEMQRLVNADSARFVGAIEQVTGPFLQIGDDINKPITDFPEPVQAIARRFEQRLSLEDIACEVLVEDPNFVKFTIQANPMLKTNYGLGPLAVDEKITRANWESMDLGHSAPQYLMQVLDLGTPVHVY